MQAVSSTPRFVASAPVSAQDGWSPWFYNNNNFIDYAAAYRSLSDTLDFYCTIGYCGGYETHIYKATVVVAGNISRIVYHYKYRRFEM
ncbi:hypothetical protein DFR72_111264 [Lentzea flaviverrucosa]|uniref:Uncharacterized protein n=2 Tax=Lentzea flaviverrucosa TaxID=200379 RepID=A0A1H9WVE2_9PSEU|nr:hypothetical protein DFR72_111264 [Lentzea flaviverrucosa]SES37779.1 hypothetical protein SAMN05216195_112258 [Lentzea flaviverrucosa]